MISKPCRQAPSLLDLNGSDVLQAQMHQAQLRGAAQRRADHREGADRPAQASRLQAEKQRAAKSRQSVTQRQRATRRKAEQQQAAYSQQNHRHTIDVRPDAKVKGGKRPGQIRHNKTDEERGSRYLLCRVLLLLVVALVAMSLAAGLFLAVGRCVPNMAQGFTMFLLLFVPVSKTSP